MGFLDRLRDAFGRRPAEASASSLVGTWDVIDISVPHPFGRYTMELRQDGSFHWTALTPTTGGGELELSGTGTWRTDGDTLHCTSGASGGTVRYALIDADLVLDRLPATKLGPGLRCVLRRAPSPPPAR
jgi:hypothetical protein